MKTEIKGLLSNIIGAAVLAATGLALLLAYFDILV